MKLNRKLEVLESAAETVPAKRTFKEVAAEFSSAELKAIIALDGGELSDFDEELSQLSTAELEAIAYGNIEDEEDDEEMIDWLYAGRARLKQNAL